MRFKPIQTVDYLVVHCSASRAGQLGSTNEPINAAEIRRWHRTRGWFDIGYHFVIKEDGEVETGRPIERPGAHARGFNEKSLGICLVGGVAKDGKSPLATFTDEQYDALEVLLDQLLTLSPNAEVLGHRDLPKVAKACPSFDVRSWWANVKEFNNGEDQGRPVEENVATEGEEQGSPQRDLPAKPPNCFWTRIRPRPKRD